MKANDVISPQISIQDAFWSPRQRQIIRKVLFAGIENVQKEGGGLSNIINAAKMHRGEPFEPHAGALYVDSDVYKLIEAMCLALQFDADGDSGILAAQVKLRELLSSWIPYLVDAQEPDGYLDTYFILKYPEQKWTDFNLHELYCAGHFYEMAIAHYRMCRGKDPRLLDAAFKSADLIDHLFGPGRWKQVPGHPEIELALLKLAALCREIGKDDRAERYENLAAFFIETRGDHTGRHGVNLDPALCQDTLPLTELKEVRGHAVRAGYLFSAMADLALQGKGGKYLDPLQALWHSASTKTYATGGIGVVDCSEGYGPDYYMPLGKSYCETCAAIADMMWNRRMCALFGEAKYADRMERALYNAILSCVNFDGDRFFYENNVSAPPRERSAWYGTACCPPNLMRTVLSLQDYLYTAREQTIALNLWIGNRAVFRLKDAPMTLEVTSGFPWKDAAGVTIHTEKPQTLTLLLRVPSWAENSYTAFLNGRLLDAAVKQRGYLAITGEWKDGDRISLRFPMAARMLPMDPACSWTKDYTAVSRGPVVYCAESAEGPEEPWRIYLPGDPTFWEIWTESLDQRTADPAIGGVMKLEMEGAYMHFPEGDCPTRVTMIPFYAACNRGPSAVEVYLSKIPRDHPSYQETEIQGYKSYL